MAFNPTTGAAAAGAGAGTAGDNYENHFPQMPMMHGFNGVTMPNQSVMRSAQSVGVLTGPTDPVPTGNHGTDGAGRTLSPYNQHQQRAQGQSEKSVYFIFTGFDKFGDVSDNPTKTLVTYLPKVLVQERILSPSNILHSDVMQVHTDAVEKAMNTIQSKVKKITGPARFFWIHFGLAAGIPTMQLELNGVNEADFDIPDESGKKLHEIPVESSDPFQRVLATPIDLPNVVILLQQAGHAVRVSADAGRFLVRFLHKT